MKLYLCYIEYKCTKIPSLNRSLVLFYTLKQQASKFGTKNKIG